MWIRRGDTRGPERPFGESSGDQMAPRMSKVSLFEKLGFTCKTTHLELVGASGGHASCTRPPLSALKGSLGSPRRPQGGANEVFWQAIKCPTGPKRRQMAHPRPNVTIFKIYGFRRVPRAPQDTLRGQNRCLQAPKQHQNVKPLELSVVFKENRRF